MAGKPEMNLTEIRTIKSGILCPLMDGKTAKWFAKKIPLFPYVFCPFHADERAVLLSDIKTKEKQVV